MPGSAIKTVKKPLTFSQYARQAKGNAPSSSPSTKKKLLILDLNNTLLCRRNRTAAGARNAVQRPFVQQLFLYIFRPDSPWQTMIWSSSQPANVDNMLVRLGFQAEPISAKPGDDGSGMRLKFDKLHAVWARDTLGLSADQYGEKVPTVKDLNKVWAHFPDFDQSNTLLVDDSKDKAIYQPYNHICLPPFELMKGEIAQNEHPDQNMLALIGYLDELEACQDVSQAIYAGVLGQALVEAGSHEKSLPESDSWISKGRAICEKLQFPLESNAIGKSAALVGNGAKYTTSSAQP